MTANLRDCLTALVATVERLGEPAHRDELRARMPALEAAELPRLQVDLIAFGDDDPRLWRQVARERFLAAEAAGDEAGLRLACRLLDGSLIRAAWADPVQLPSLLAEWGPRLRALADRLDGAALGPEVRLRAAAIARAETGELAAVEMVGVDDLPPASVAVLRALAGHTGWPDPAAASDDGLGQLRREAWLRAVNAASAGLVQALRDETARTRGPDWPDQAWDSYAYRQFVKEEQQVTVPFAALRHGTSPVVPVAAAERILGLPDDDAPPRQVWERPREGRYYKRYWSRQRRFLSLVADIAARFPDDGGQYLASELRSRQRGLPPDERRAVALHCAALGLLDEDPAALAQEVLEAAGSDELGARGDLLLHALRRVDVLPEGQRRELLREVYRVARLTTRFIASNPFAAAVEALAAAEVGSVPELVELVDRAVVLKVHDWEGWDRALHAAARSVEVLAASRGEAVVAEAVAALAEYRDWFPSLEASLWLAGATGQQGAAAVTLAQRALAESARLGPTAAAFQVAAGACRQLAAAGGEGAGEELHRWAARARDLATGHDQQVGLQALVAAFCAAGGTAEAIAEAVALTQMIRDPHCRWLAAGLLAVSGRLPAEQAATMLAESTRAGRRWLVRPAPEHVLVVSVGQLADVLPEPAAHPLVAAAYRLADDIATGRLAGERLGAAVAGLGQWCGEPAVLDVLAQVAAELGPSWWRLPVLVLLADGTAGWLAGRADAAGRAGRPATRPH